MTELFSPDYARFRIEDGVVIAGERMQKKLEAIPFPDLKGKTVLDVGCDYGQFSFWAANQGAKGVRGLDRGRDVRGVGLVNLPEENNKVARQHENFRACSFNEINLGKQWRDFGQYDVIFMFSMYHHVFENVGDHKPIWFWLWRQCAKGGVVLWENPVDLKDVVSNKHISGGKREEYTREAIFYAASRYFDVEHIGGAKHEPHREVYRLTRKELNEYGVPAALRDGAGGATPAFLYKDGRRQDEVQYILGYRPYPGSLNMAVPSAFDWDHDYFRAEVLDVSERGKGLDVEWKKRWVRLYPIKVDGVEAHVFRFEGENYRPTAIEAIAPYRLRDLIQPEHGMVAVTRC